MPQDRIGAAPEDGEAPPSHLGRALVAGALLCMVTAGLLLWSRQGDAVFSDLVLTAVAWCF